MSSEIISRRTSLKIGLGLAGSGVSLGLSVDGLANSSKDSNAKSPPAFTLDNLDLSDPVKKSHVVTKVMGSVGKEETHSFLRFHIYGFSGDNCIPFFSMNNYVVQKWEPSELAGEYMLKHYEVGYYTEFDTDKAITHWINPITNEEIELEQFVLGPVHRRYTPSGIIAPGIAPQPLRVSVIADRVFVPAQSIEKFPTMFPPEEWPEFSNQSHVFWDSMYTYSAYLKDVLNPDLNCAPAEIHMQNLTSWQPFLRLGKIRGRSMARAFGQNISGFEALPKSIIKDFETYTPEIFETATWEKTRFDSIEYYKKVMAEKQAREAQ